MAIRKSDFATGIKQMPIAQGGEVLSVRVAFTLPAFGAGDVIELLVLPEDHVPIDWYVDVDDIDTNGSPTATFDVGIINAAETAVSAVAADGGAKWATALTTAQAGGFVRNTGIATGRTLPSATGRRFVGVVAVGAAATFAAGVIAMTLFYRAGHYGA